MTQSGTAVGTLTYMSPEQIKGQTVDRRSDIFALGIILYELLSGKMPFDGDNMSTIVYKIVNEQPQRITEINQDIPVGYDLVVQKALAKNPDERYQNCRQLTVALESAGKATEQISPAKNEDPRLRKAQAKDGLIARPGLWPAPGLSRGASFSSRSGRPSKPDSKSAALK